MTDDEELDLIAHKMRVHLNNKQAAWMRDTCIASRMAYNFAIDQLRKPFVEYLDCLDAADEPAKFSSRIDGALQPALIDFKKIKFPSAFDVSKKWTIERDIRHPWIRPRGLNLDTVASTFNNNYGAALNQWRLAKWARDKMPTYHGKGAKLSATFRGRALKRIDAKHFALPSKMGAFKLGCPLRFDGEVRSVTFSESGGKWFAAFLVKAKVPRPDPAPLGTAVGVDVGVVQFASLSTGEQFPPAQDYARELDKLAKLQRAMARKDGPVKGRKKKPSKNWLEAKRKVQKQFQRIANKRRHYTEVVSKDLAGRFETIAVEDLKLKNMTASAKGDAAEPGKNVAQKSGLNRSILNGGFYQFRTRLEAKAGARGGRVIGVNPAYTSQTCPACGTVDKANRPDQATFRCVECGHEDHADVNAAKNILMRALSPDESIAVPSRRKADRGRQETLTPESLVTEPAGVLAQEVATQGASSGTAQADGLEKRVKRAVQLDWLLHTAA
jgi:IS605 OrfB family transposase